MKKIKLIEATIVAGKGYLAGELINVPKDVSENDARYLVAIYKAVVVDDDKDGKHKLESKKKTDPADLPNAGGADQGANKAQG